MACDEKYSWFCDETVSTGFVSSVEILECGVSCEIREVATVEQMEGP